MEFLYLKDIFLNHFCWRVSEFIFRRMLCTIWTDWCSIAIIQTSRNALNRQVYNLENHMFLGFDWFQFTTPITQLQINWKAMPRTRHFSIPIRLGMFIYLVGLDPFSFNPDYITSHSLCHSLMALLSWWWSDEGIFKCLCLCICMNTEHEVRLSSLLPGIYGHIHLNWWKHKTASRPALVFAKPIAAQRLTIFTAAIVAATPPHRRRRHRRVAQRISFINLN